MIKHRNFKDKKVFFNLSFKEIDIKKRGKKKILKISVLMLIAAVGCCGIFTLKKITNVNACNENIARSEYTILKKGKSIENKTFIGDISCQESINVSAKVYNCQIKEVNFKLGDKVKAGDILARLDSKDLEKQIEDIKNKNNQQENKNKTLLEQKKINYDAAVKNRDEESNADIVAAKNEVKSKEDIYNNAKQIYEEAKVKLSNAEISEPELNAEKLKCDNAQNEYELSKIKLQNLRDKLELVLEEAKKDYELEKIESNNITSKNELENKIGDLEKYNITSPVDGVIVEATAEVGKNADGILFKIQNMDKSVANIYIRENDVDKLEVGQKANVMNYITGKNSMNGTIMSIEPIENIISDNRINLKDKNIDKKAAYVGQIAIDNSDNVLKDETEVKVEVQIDDREAIYRLPLGNIVNEGDNKFIYIADKIEEQYIVKKIPVILGKETKFDVEISGDNIKEGLIVLNNPGKYEVGSILNIDNIAQDYLGEQ